MRSCKTELLQIRIHGRFRKSVANCCENSLVFTFSVKVVIRSSKMARPADSSSEDEKLLVKYFKTASWFNTESV